MFKIKICGITKPDDAAQSVPIGADAIGLNFYEKSSRFVSDDEASEIIAATSGRAACVGVFVNSTVEEIQKRMLLPLTHVQLHGDESPEMVSELSDWPVIRAIRLQPEADDQQAIEAANAEIRKWTGAGVVAVLLDAAAPRHYGGTGTKLSWPLVSQLECSVPIILAGGLTGENVSAAIATAAPHAVDVASGVESEPGTKDLACVRLFIEQAKAAFRIN